MSEEFPEKPKRTEGPADSLVERSGAILLIGLGVVFLLVQADVFDLTGNWWAIFIFFPAAAMLYNAYTGYQRDGVVSEDVRKNISGGVFVGTVAIVAATGEWDKLWPLFLIVLGALMLFGFLKRGD
jgi:hypothetical protein